MPVTLVPDHSKEYGVVPPAGLAVQVITFILGVPEQVAESGTFWAYTSDPKNNIPSAPIPPIFVKFLLIIFEFSIFFDLFQVVELRFPPDCPAYGGANRSFTTWFESPVLFDCVWFDHRLLIPALNRSLKILCFAAKQANTSSQISP